MASQFTASEHLNGPGHLFRRMSTSPRSASFIVWSSTRNLYMEKSASLGMNLCESGQLSRVLMCLSKQSPDAVVAHSVQLRVSVCLRVLFSVFFLHVTCTDDPHRLKCAINAQIRSQLNFIVHPCIRIVEQIVDVPVSQNFGTCCYWIISQRNCAW